MDKKETRLSEKRFDEWNVVKKRLHHDGKIRSIKQREVWWASCGENIGVEINGKDKLFLRPVLVFKKFNKCFFLAIPLTSVSKEGPWCISFPFQGKISIALLSHVKSMSVSRLIRKMGEVDDGDFKAIKQGFLNYYS